MKKPQVNPYTQKKNPTKSQVQSDIVELHKRELKKSHIKGLVQGRELAFMEILEILESGEKTNDDIIEYLKKCLGDQTFEKLLNKDVDKEKEL